MQTYRNRGRRGTRGGYGRLDSASLEPGLEIVLKESIGSIPKLAGSNPARLVF